MQQADNSDAASAARQLVERLREVRQQNAGTGEEELRHCLEQALEQTLGGADDESTAPVLDQARTLLIGEARQRESQLEDLRQRCQQLQTEVETIRGERDRLLEEKEGLTSEQAASAGPTESADAVVRALARGLMEISKGKKADTEAAGLPASADRIFRLLRELVEFAFRVEAGRLKVLAELKVDVYEHLRTVDIITLQQEIRKQFQAVLRDESGSLKKFKETLRRNASFAPSLTQSFSMSVQRGAESLLSGLDPHPIREKHSGMLGSFKSDDAFQEISKIQRDLAGLSAEEHWDRFFLAPLLNDLAQWALN